MRAAGPCLECTPYVFLELLAFGVSISAVDRVDSSERERVRSYCRGERTGPVKRNS